MVVMPILLVVGLLKFLELLLLFLVKRLFIRKRKLIELGELFEPLIWIMVLYALLLKMMILLKIKGWLKIILIHLLILRKLLMIKGKQLDFVNWGILGDIEFGTVNGQKVHLYGLMELKNKLMRNILMRKKVHFGWALKILINILLELICVKLYMMLMLNFMI